MLTPLEHANAEQKTEETLGEEGRAHLASNPVLQIVAELMTNLRALELPWWSPEFLRERWSATERMRWLKGRPDLRQRITTALTGLAPNAARKKTAEFQASLLDSVVDEGDVSPRRFDEAFDAFDLVLYGPVAEFWATFMERMPWYEDTAPHQELIAVALDALLAEESALEGMTRKPILTPLQVRTAIDGRVWHTRMPLEVRIAIDEARLLQEAERPREPFHAEHDLAIAASSVIAGSIPLRELLPVFRAAERAMGFVASAARELRPTPSKLPAALGASAAAALPAIPAMPPLSAAPVTPKDAGVTPGGAD